MNLARSTYYDAGDVAPDDAVLGEIREIVGEFRGYGYRRVSAELRHRGRVVNSKKVRRIMRENDLKSEVKTPPCRGGAAAARRRQTPGAGAARRHHG